MNPGFGILVLAAGKSSRFGSDKLLAAMPDGRPLIAHSLAPLQEMAKRYDIKLCVVTRASNHELISYLLENDISYTEYPDTKDPDIAQGIGCSIAHGIKTNSLWQGWMIALADMPNLTANIVEVLITNIIQSPHQIVRPSISKEYKEIPLHPAYFPQSYKLQLSELTGDNGAKNIIQQQKLININDANLLVDVDTVENLLHLKL